MTTKLMTIFTRTPLHVGAGSSVGAVDSPIIRERHTQFPVIPGSSIKGVLADLWNDWVNRDENGKPTRNPEGKELFGREENKKTEEEAKAGSLLIGEGKLLAFPVRSAKGCFAWITCPLALNRFLRDSGRGIKLPKEACPESETEVVAANGLCINGSVVFEEYPLENKADGSYQEILPYISDLCEDPLWREELSKRFAILSDDMFTYFVKNACEIAQHNRINDETGVVDDGALFNQENVPSEALFYSVINFKSSDDEIAVKTKLDSEKNLLQIGANATTGLGWCSVALKEVK